MVSITFGLDGNAQKYQLGGWSDPEDSFTWSTGSNAEILLQRGDLLGDVFVFIRLCPFVNLPRLPSQRLLITVDGELAFTGRCWGNQRLAIKLKFEAGDDKQFSVLTAHFPDAVEPMQFGISDSRKLAFMWRSIDIVPLRKPTIAGRPSKNKASKMEGMHALTRTMEEWVEEELRPWRLHPPQRLDCEFIFAHLNATTHWAAIYRFHNGQVDFIPKPPHVDLDTVVFDRAQLYLRFFRSLLRRLPSDLEITICVCVADYPMRVEEVPILAFQKSLGMETILLPDIDFLLHDFFTAAAYHDVKGYLEKKVQAIFVGSTSGGDITKQVADLASLPRLSSATHFENSEYVHFYLPVIVQCASKEAEEVLRSKKFCMKPFMTWQEQCEYRFQISMDGNGAACSRLALSLRSNSALLKYESRERLYYFHGLKPWKHFIPISEDGDVTKVIAEELTCPGVFRSIACDGRDFASQFLNEEAIATYSALLLIKYSDIFVR